MRVYVLSTLANVYGLTGQIDAGVAALRDRVQIDPSPEGWCSLATFYHYDAKDHGRALAAIEKAVERAHERGEFIRYVHGMQVRIALTLQRYDLVEVSLRELLQRPTNLGDTAFLERDFLNRIPRDKVDAGVLQRYEKAVANQNPG